MEEERYFIHPFMSTRGQQQRFYIHDFPEKERISKIITWGYGALDPEPGGEYTIELASPDYDAGDREVYSIEYVIACCAKRKTLNLKDFRLNKISKYNSDFDPMCILEHSMSWSEAEKYRKEPQSPQIGSSISCTCTEHTGDVRNSLRVEHKKIIKCIMEFKAYNLVHGKDFWRMLEKQVWKNRKWHCLKQEFYEKILPNIESFHLTERQIASFKSVRNNASRWLHKRNQRDDTLCRESKMNAEKNISCLEEEKANEVEEDLVLINEKKGEEISRRKSGMCGAKSKSCMGEEKEREVEEIIVLDIEEECCRIPTVNHDMNKVVCQEKQKQVGKKNEDEMEDLVTFERPTVNHDINKVVCQEKQKQVGKKNEDEMEDLVSFERRNGGNRPSHKRNEKTDTHCRARRMCDTKSTSCQERNKKNEPVIVIVLESEEEEDISKRDDSIYIPSSEEVTSASSEDLQGKSRKRRKKKHSRRKQINHNGINVVCPEKWKENGKQKVKNGSPFKRTTNYYREKEDRAIINFISSRERYYQTGGVKLWKLMERKQVVPGRSWQSMKERYRKVLINKLDNYLPSNKVKKLKEAELKGTDMIKRIKIKEDITPSKRVDHSKIKVAVNRIETNHIPGLKCTCCFDFEVEDDEIEDVAENLNITANRNPETADTINPNNRNPETADTINSKIAVTKNSKPGTSNTKSKESNILMSVPDYLKENDQEHVTNKGPKRKLFSQRQSLSEFTPVSDEEKVVYHSIKPHKLFEKKKSGKVIVKKPESSNDVKEKFTKKSNLLMNKSAANKENNTNLKDSNNITSSFKTSNNHNHLNSQNNDIATRRKQNIMQNSNEKCHGKASHSQASSKVSLNDKSSKYMRQLTVRLVHCDDLHLKHPIATAASAMATEAKGSNKIIRNKHDANENTQFVLPDLRVSSTNDNEIIPNNNKDKNDTTTGEASMISESEEAELANSLFIANEHMLREISETQEILGSTFIDEMLDGKQVADELLGQKKTVTNKENNVNDKPENGLNVSIQSKEEGLQAACNSHCNQNVENMDASIVENESVSLKEGEEVNSSNSNCKNISNGLEQEVEKMADDGLSSSNSSSTENNLSQIHNDVMPTNKDKLNEDSTNAKEILCYKKQIGVSNCTQEINSQIENNIQGESSPVFHGIQCGDENVQMMDIDTVSHIEANMTASVEKGDSHSSSSYKDTSSDKGERIEEIAHSLLNNTENTSTNEIQNIEKEFIEQNKNIEETNSFRSQSRLNKHKQETNSQIENNKTVKESYVSHSSSLSERISSTSDENSSQNNFSTFEINEPLESELIKQTVSYRDRRVIQQSQGSEIYNATVGSHQNKIQNSEEKCKDKSVDMEAKINRNRNPADGHNEITASEITNNELNFNCFNETDSSGIDVADEKLCSTDSSDYESTSVMSGNNRAKHETHFAIYNQREKEMYKNVVMDNESKQENFNHVNVIIKNNSENEIIEKTGKSNIANNVYNCNRDSNSDLRNSEKVIQYLKTVHVSSETQCAENRQNIDMNGMSSKLLDNKHKDELSEDHLKTYIQQLFSRDFELASESKNEILDLPQDVSLLAISDENVMECLDDKSVILEMPALDIYGENNRSLQQHPINDGEINLSEIKHDHSSVDKTQSQCSNERDVSSEDIKLESEMADIVDDAGNHLAVDTEVIKQSVKCNELLEDSKHSCVTLQEKSHDQGLHVLLYDEIKKQDNYKDDENFHSASNHLTEHTYCLQGSDSSTEHEAKTSSSIDSYSSKNIYKHRFKSKKLKHNTSEQLVVNDEAYNCEPSPLHSFSSHQESLSSRSSLDDHPNHRKGVRQQSFNTETSSVIRKKKSSSHSYYNRKLIRQTRRYTSNSIGKSTQQFTDSSTGVSIDLNEDHNRQMLYVDSVVECSTSYEVIKRKKLKSDDHCSVCDSGLGMEPRMDEVNCRKKNCQQQYDDNVDKSRQRSDSAIHFKDLCSLPATNDGESLVKKTQKEHCAIN